MINLLRDAQHKVGDRYYARAGVAKSNNVKADTEVTKADLGLDVIIKSYITFQYTHITPDNGASVSKAKHRGVQELHSMLYGDIQRELNELRCIALQQGSTEISVRLENLLGAIEL